MNRHSSRRRRDRFIHLRAIEVVDERPASLEEFARLVHIAEGFDFINVLAYQLVVGNWE